MSEPDVFISLLYVSNSMTIPEGHIENVPGTWSASVNVKAGNLPWKGIYITASEVCDQLFSFFSGHHMNLSNLMLVLKEVTDLDRVSNALALPAADGSGDREERLGKVSNFFLLTHQTWKQLKNLLLRYKEYPAARIVNLMEQYVREGKDRKHLCIYL